MWKAQLTSVAKGAVSRRSLVTSALRINCVTQEGNCGSHFSENFSWSLFGRKVRFCVPNRTDLPHLLQLIKKTFPRQAQDSASSSRMCYRTFVPEAAVFLVRWTELCCMSVDTLTIPHRLPTEGAISCVLALFHFTRLFNFMSFQLMLAGIW